MSVLQFPSVISSRVMGLSFTGWGKPWSRHRGADLARVSYSGRVGTASPIAEPLGDQRVSSSIRGDAHEQCSRSKYHTHASFSTPSRRFGGFPRATHGKVAAALSWGVLRCGRPFWLLGAAFGCGRAPGGDFVPRTFRSMKEPVRWVMWAIRRSCMRQKRGEECAQNTQQNMTLWRLRTADSAPLLSAVSLPGSAHG